MKSKGKIVISKNGPYRVSGALPLDTQIIVTDEDGLPLGWKQGKKYKVEETYSLCRCGKSKNMPFCDGSHKAGFDGTLTASDKKYSDQVEILEGPELDLSDASSLCAGAGFCDRAGGTWELTLHSDNLEARKTAIQQCGNCPSGRLVAIDKSGKIIEPKLEPGISLIEDPTSDERGPIWVKGGIEIESEDGQKYETRNRVTLCCCGKSKNKPFCDGSHIDSHFNDGEESLRLNF